MNVEATCTYSLKQSQLGCDWGENIIFIWEPRVWNRYEKSILEHFW